MTRRRQRNDRQQATGGRRGRRRDPDAPAASPRRSLGSYGDLSRRVVYVACEGARTEPAYLTLLNRAYGRRDDTDEFHLHYCDPGHDNGLRPVEAVDQVLAEAGPEDEKWALFDRDSSDNRERDIPQAMRKAHKHGVQVALSHPSFELWLLLHFQPWTSRENGVDGTIKERLRGHRDAKGFEDYDKASGDRGKGLGGQRGESLLNRERAAVRNARKLVDFCEHGQCSAKASDRADGDPVVPDEPSTYEQWTARTGHAPGCDPLKRDPSSDVWRLLKALDIGTGDR